jgi:CRP/FNR family cyclic AMP-dependent transcriptional regulator
VADLQHFLSTVPLFGAATESELDTLAGSAFGRLLKRGQALVREGQPSDLLFVVVEGRLKVYVGSERGEHLSLAVVGAGEVIGLFGIVDGQPRLATIEALEDARLVCIRGEDFHALLRSSAGLSLAVAEELAFRIRDVTGSAADLVFLDLPRRLVKLLLATSGADGLSLTQSEIADQLGAARTSVNRNLSSFQRRGWVEIGHKNVRVLDREALSSFGGS